MDIHMEREREGRGKERNIVIQDPYLTSSMKTNSEWILRFNINPKQNFQETMVMALCSANISQIYYQQCNP